MKKLKLVLSLVLLGSIAAVGQVSVNVNLGTPKVTVATPPVWAPANREEVQYYYLPEIDSYYDVPSAKFIYLRNGKWFRSAALPAQYRNYNLKGGQVVYLSDYKGNAPYTFHKNHKIKYAKSYKVKESEYEIKGKDYHNNHDNGNGHGKGKKNK